MKKLFSLIATIALLSSIFAQSPEKMSYQAIIRNNSNNLVTSVPVGMKISILQGSAEGTVVYAETQSPESNANGLVSIEIGTGTTSDDFSAIDWSSGPYYIKTETDPSGGANYTIIGTSQILSVPYALYSETAGNVFSGSYIDLTNKPTTLAGYGISDGMNTSHAANGITSGLIANWNTAFGWGDHDGLYRPIGYVPTWNEVTGKPTFATVATSGSYNDLTDTPTILGSQWTTAGSNIYYNTAMLASAPAARRPIFMRMVLQSPAGDSYPYLHHPGKVYSCHCTMTISSKLIYGMMSAMRIFDCKTLLLVT